MLLGILRDKILDLEEIINKFNKILKKNNNKKKNLKKIIRIKLILINNNIKITNLNNSIWISLNKIMIINKIILIKTINNKDNKILANNNIILQILNKIKTIITKKLFKKVQVLKKESNMFLNMMINNNKIINNKSNNKNKMN